MRYYYASGLPYSDELYHHGILGQKWGIRRFQNKDGTRTPAGKKRYSSEQFKAAAKKAGDMAAKAGKATGKAAAKATKATGKYLLRRLKRRYPSLMTDEELKRERERLNLEISVKEARREMKNHSAWHKAKRIIEDAAGNFAKNAASTAGTKLADKLINKAFEDKNKRRIDDLTTSMRSQLATEVNNKANRLDRRADNENAIADNNHRIEEIDRRVDAINNQNTRISANSSQQERVQAANLTRERTKLNNERDRLSTLNENLERRNAAIDREVTAINNRIKDRRDALSALRESNKGGNGGGGNNN